MVSSSAMMMGLVFAFAWYAGPRYGGMSLNRGRIGNFACVVGGHGIESPDGFFGVCNKRLEGALSSCYKFLSCCAGVQIFRDQLFTEVGAPFEETLLHFFHEAGDFWVA